MVGRFDTQFEAETSASVGYDFGPIRLDKNEGDWPYRQAAGDLLWMSGVKRPNIVRAVWAVARHAYYPAARDWKTSRKIIAYLKVTKNLGLRFDGKGL